MFQIYHGENKLHLNEMIMMSALYYIDMLRWICIVLGHWHNSPRVDMSFDSDTLSSFRANQSFLLLFNVVGIVDMNQMTIW
jgi:hypothetical protein